MPHIIMPLPARDFDPTEVGVGWAVLTQRGHRVSFATLDGAPATGGEIMLTGKGLILAGGLLRANADGRRASAAMAASAEFAAPLRWADLGADAFDGLVLGGGHRARGMHPYLESPQLQALTTAFFAAGKPVGAICHGVLLAARSPATSETGRSVLHGRKTTALTWRLEKTADAIARIARFWDGGYYRTYPDPPGRPRGYMSVQQEVTRALASPTDFLDAVPGDADYGLKTSGTVRDTMDDGRCALVVRDRNHVSARWPGDAHSFAKTFAAVLEGG